jgi:hypothetical protein
VLLLRQPQGKKKAPILSGPNMVIPVIIALLAPFGVRMPPPQLIYKLIVHFTANMAWENDFSKFFYS